MIASEPVGVVRSGGRRHHPARFAPLPRSKLPPRRPCMSSRTVPRFALTVLLVAALAAPATAQDSPPQAPPPRESGDVIRSIHTYDIALLRELHGLPQPEVAPAPREKTAD